MKLLEWEIFLKSRHNVSDISGSDNYPKGVL